MVGTYNRSAGEMLHWAKASPGGTPLNFLAQKLVLDGVGLSSFSARLPAVIFGAGSLWVFHSIARARIGENWGNLATAMFAVIPQIFRYGVEARPYSQGMFFSLLAFRFWLRLEENPSTRNAALFGLAITGGLYSQVFSVFVAVGLAAWSLRNRASRVFAAAALASAGLAYLPWFLAQRATQAVTQTMSNYSFTWDQVSIHGLIRELAGGGYFVSVPLLILAVLGLASRARDWALPFAAAAGLILPIAADATLGYFFAGRQLIFALPFLILLAAKAAGTLKISLRLALLVPLFTASLVSNVRQATKVLEDWQTPARVLAGSGCVYVWTPDLLKYLQVYERSLKQCDPENLPDEFSFVTTRYSSAGEPPKQFIKLRSEHVGVTEIAHYRRDASLKTYGLSRFVFRP